MKMRLNNLELQFYSHDSLSTSLEYSFQLASKWLHILVSNIISKLVVNELIVVVSPVVSLVSVPLPSTLIHLSLIIKVSQVILKSDLP